MNAHPGQLQDNDIATIEAEQALLGTLFTSPDSFLNVSAIMKPEYFSEPVHATVYGAIVECRNNGRKGSLHDVRQYLGTSLDKQLGEGVSVALYLSRLSAAATGSSAMDHAWAVRDLWAVRITEKITGTIDYGLPSQALSRIFDQMDQLRLSIEEAAVTRSSVGDVVADVVTNAAKIASGQKEQPGITTGLPILDEAMLGLRPGELVIMAGRPGMGKSTVATSMALAASDMERQGRRGGVGFFAFELGREAIGARIAADLASSDRHGPAHSEVRAGKVTDEQLWALEETIRSANARPLIIDSRSTATVGEIEAACLAMRREFEKKGRRLDVVFIDYIKQVRATDRYRGNKVYEIGEITYGLRDIAKRLQICVVLLVQLNRAVENRDNKRPTLADLRESGDIENDADVVMLLYRHAYYLSRELREEDDPTEQSAIRHELSKCEHEIEIILAKNRNGEGERVVKAYCDIGRSAIRPLDYRHGMENAR